MTTKTKGLSFTAAIRTNKPLRRHNKGFRYRYTTWYPAGDLCIMPKSWIHPQTLLQDVELSREDVLARDWEVKHDNKD